MTKNSEILKTVRSGLRLLMIFNVFVLGCLLAALVLVAGAGVGQVALVAGVGLAAALTAAVVLWRLDLREVEQAQQAGSNNGRDQADQGGFGF